MRAKITVLLVLVVMASALTGCIDSSGPAVPSANEIDGYVLGSQAGKAVGFIEGFNAYAEVHNIEVLQAAAFSATSERLPGYKLGFTQGKASAYGYGYDYGIFINEPDKWAEMGYILSNGETTATDFYAGLGYDISEYKTGDLTDILKEGADQREAKAGPGGDSEVEVITYKSIDKDLVEIVEAEVRSEQRRSNSTYTWQPDRLREA